MSPNTQPPEPPPLLKALPKPQRPRLRALLDEALTRQDPTLLYATAVLAMEHEHAALAEASLREALRLAPELEPARWALLELLEGHAPERADRLLLAEGTPEALRRAGALAAQRRDYARALERWSELDDIPATLARALLRLRLLDLEGAGRDLSALLRRVQRLQLWEALLLERVRVAVELGEPSPRINALFERALERLGPTAAILAQLEIYAVDRGQHALLLRGLEARLEGAHGEARRALRFKIAWTLEQLGRLEEALTAWRAALADEPEDALILDRALALSRRLGRVELEWSLLQRRAERPGVDAAGVYYQAGLLAREILDEPERAKQDFERALAARPDYSPALAALGRVDLREGRLAEIDARFEAELAALSVDEEGHRRQIVDRLCRWAELSAARGAKAEAARLWSKARALDPKLASAPLGRLLASERRWRALARLYLAPPPADDPDGPARRLLSAELLRLRADDDEAAAQVYDALLAQTPSPEARAASEEIAARGGPRAWAAWMAARAPDRLRYAQLLEWVDPSEQGQRAAAERYRAALPGLEAEEGLLRCWRRLGDEALLEALPPEGSARAAEARLRAGLCAGLDGAQVAPEIALAAGARRGGLAWSRAHAARALALEEANKPAEAARAWVMSALAAWGRDAEHAREALRSAAALAPDEPWLSRLKVDAPRAEGHRALKLARAHAHDPARRRQALEALAEHAEGAESEALMAMTTPARLSAWSARRFEVEPHRRDLFLASLSAAPPRGRQALRWRRLPHAPRAEQIALLRALITEALELEDRAEAERALEALEALAPEDLTLALAWDHLDGAEAPSEALLSQARATENRLALHRRGATSPDPRARRRHLEAAFALAPDDDALFEALSDALEAEGDERALAALVSRRSAEGRAHPDRLLSQAARTEEPRAALRLKLGALRLTRDPDLALEVLADAGALGLVEAADEAFDLSDQGDEARARWVEAYAADPDEASSRLAPALRPGAPPRIWALSAEVEGRRKNWRGVAQALSMQLKGARTPEEGAAHAEALGEVFSRALGDHRRAAGWFKRAVEMDSERLGAVWRMLAAADSLPEGQIPQAHVDDALDRAIAAQRQALRVDPLDAPRLRQLARLLHRRGDMTAAAEVCAALVYLGAADRGAANLHAQAPLRGPLTPTNELSLDRAALSVAGERSPTAQAFALCAPLFEFGIDLREAEAPAGPWRALVERAAVALGVGHVQVGVGEIGAQLPQRIDLSEALLGAPRTPTLVFEVIRHVDALYGRRALLLKDPHEALSRLNDVFFEGGDELFSPGLRARLAALSEEVTEGGVLALAEAVERTADRAGLLWAGDPAPILDLLLFEGPAEAREAHRQGTIAARLRRHARARALFGFWISADLLRLRAHLEMEALDDPT